MFIARGVKDGDVGCRRLFGLSTPDVANAHFILFHGCNIGGIHR